MVRQRGAAARARAVTEFGMNAMVAGYQNLYNELLN